MCEHLALPSWNERRAVIKALTETDRVSLQRATGNRGVVIGGNDRREIPGKAELKGRLTGRVANLIHHEWCLQEKEVGANRVSLLLSTPYLTEESS